MKKVNPIPQGFSTVTPYLIVKGCAQALEFYKLALNATELSRYSSPDGSIAHAEIRIGNSNLMMGDECADHGHVGPKTLKGSPVSFMVYVEDVDRIAAQAVAAGMKVKRPVENQFYGDRLGIFEDPYGHTWSIGTHIEDVTDDEIRKRAQAKYGG